jgi:hypothetical protein
MLQFIKIFALNRFRLEHSYRVDLNKWKHLLQKILY